MKLIGLEEHWCPRELFDREDSPGYAAMAGVRSMFTPEQLKSVYESISDIGEVRIKMMDKLGLSMQILSICNVNMEVLSDEDS